MNAEAELGSSSSRALKTEQLGEGQGLLFSLGDCCYYGNVSLVLCFSLV